MKAISKKKLMDHACSMVEAFEKEIFDVVKKNGDKPSKLISFGLPIFFNNAFPLLIEELNDNHLFNQDDYIFVEE